MLETLWGKGWIRMVPAGTKNGYASFLKRKLLWAR
jgi:hypothetical protein